MPQIDFKKYNVNISMDDDEQTQKTEVADPTVRGRVFDQTKPESFNQVCNLGTDASKKILLSDLSLQFSAMDMRGANALRRASN